MFKAFCRTSYKSNENCAFKIKTSIEMISEK